MSRIFDKNVSEEKLHFNTSYQNLEDYPKKPLECAKEVFDNKQDESDDIFKVTTRTVGLIKAQGNVDEQAETEFSRCCCCTSCTRISCSASSMESDIS